MSDAAARFLTEHFEAHPELHVRLNQPAKLTVRMINGAYRKVAFIGDEFFHPVSAYAGKRNAPIIVLEPIGSTVVGMEALELTLKDASTYLTGFADMVGRILTSHEEAIVAQSRPRETPEEEDRRHQDDERWGTW